LEAFKIHFDSAVIEVTVTETSMLQIFYSRQWWM